MRPGQIAYQDFLVSSKMTFGTDKTFMTEINFKKGEDIEVAAEKLYLQDGLSSIYIKDSLIPQFEELNYELMQSNSVSKITSLYNDKSYLSKLSTKWVDYWKNKQDAEEELANDEKRVFLHDELSRVKFCVLFGLQVFRDKYFSTLSDAKKRKDATKKVLDKTHDKTNEEQAKELEEMIAKGNDQDQINQKVHEHIKKIEELKKILDKKMQSTVADLCKKFKDGFLTDFQKLSALGKTKLTYDKRPNTQASVKKHGVTLALGTQKKYPYRLVVSAANIIQLIDSKPMDMTRDPVPYESIEIPEDFEQTYQENLIANRLCAINPIYGVKRSVIINFVTLKTNPAENGEELKDESIFFEMHGAFREYLANAMDLHFESFEKQIKAQLRKQILQKSGTEEEERSYWLIPTKHSCLGKYNEIWSIVVRDAKKIYEDKEYGIVRDLLRLMNDKVVEEVVFPFDWLVGSNSQKYSDKTIQESGTNLLRSVKSGLNELALNHQVVHNFKKVRFVFLDWDVEQCYAKVREILNRVL